MLEFLDLWVSGWSMFVEMIMLVFTMHRTFYGKILIIFYCTLRFSWFWHVT